MVYGEVEGRPFSVGWFKLQSIPQLLGYFIADHQP